MALDYKHLDDSTRAFMLAELERDIATDALFLSDNLTDRGRAEYPDLLRAAARNGTDSTLADDLSTRLNPFEKPRMRKGTLVTPKIRSNAHEMLGEGEFNRLYMRALCLRVIEEGRADLEIYRAKDVNDPRPESQAKIGQRIAAAALLEDLRTHKGVDTALGLPAGPNSGLCAKIPQE